ncbi:hypothetical protein NP493_217g06065 [Ridgeia piscesae]|uniref:Uncharacterized protein n=1 Tax=Ridgeia piscesae TaxID=27915 RepID=A0AAD9UDZ4_RIDPI|nr:hypothetical protein NP493_217g06065 [Ridgeia piscesae]
MGYENIFESGRSYLNTPLYRHYAPVCQARNSATATTRATTSEAAVQSWTRSRGAAMIPVSYSESVSVRSDSVKEQSYVSYCDLETPRRSKSCVRLEQRLSPTTFRETIVCYKDCSRKRYRSESEAVTSDGESDVFSPAPDSDPSNRINGNDVIVSNDVTSCDRLRSSANDGDTDENMNYKNAKNTVEISEHYRIKLVVGGDRSKSSCNGQRTWPPPSVGVTNGSFRKNGHTDNGYLYSDEDMEM